MAVLPPTVQPIQPPTGSEIDFGAQIEGIDLENVTGVYIYFHNLNILANVLQTNNSPLSATHYIIIT
jgi:hypothetical protein